MHAYSPSSAGTANIQIDGSTVETGIAIGGTALRSVMNGWLTYETAFAPDGSKDTMLWGFDCTSGKLTKKDDDGGVGTASRMNCNSGACDLCSIVVSAFSPGDAGAMTFYVNDMLTDTDGDGLGHNLESELGTCDVSSGSCASYPNANSIDTDRDGISDSAEIFGVDDTSAPVYLPKWGANPRHKDIFIEYDWETPSKPANATASFANSYQSAFSGAPNADILNPDGLAGVNTHIDIGIAVTGTTAYGDWGGSHSGSPAVLTASRVGTFREAVAVTTAYNASPGPYFKHNGVTATFEHEGGHSMNLSHWGPWNNAEAAVECKPNYRSLMNYACSAWSGCTTFSTGSNATIDASSISEGDSWPAPQPAPDFLSTSVNPFRFNVSGRTIDWNRDGLWEASGTLVRGSPTHINPTSGGQCYTARLKQQTLKPELSFMATNPKLVKRGTHLYTFYGKASPSDQAIYLQHALVGSADNNASCTGSSSVATGSAACNTYSAEMSVSLGESISGFSAYEWGNGIILAYRTTSGALKSVYTNTFDPTTFDPSSWSSPRNHSITTPTEPELSIMYTSSGTSLGMFYVTSTSTYRWLSFTPSTLDGTSTWTDMGEIQSGGASIGGDLSPSLTAWPSRTLSTTATRRACGVFGTAGSSGAIDFYCFDQSSGAWTKFPNIFDTALFSDKRTNTKPSLAYHVNRTSTGAPLAGNERGQFWLTTMRPCWYGDCPFYRVSDRLDASNPPSTSLRFNTAGNPDSPEITMVSGTGATLFEDGSMSSLKAAWSIALISKSPACPGGITGDACLHYEVWALPVFDGSFKGNLVDVSDFRVMERGLCYSLHLGDADTKCGSGSTWGY